MNDVIAEKLLLEIIQKSDFIINKKWLEARFFTIKQISPTEKGDIAEDFLADILKKTGYTDIEIKRGRRGDYDVALNKKVFFEVKIATQDVSDNFQFNGIRYDRKYTHLFCLGVSPDSLYYLIVEKKFIGSGIHKMVSMAKGSNASFKLTKTIKDLNSFSKFKDNIEKILIGITKENWIYK